MKHVQANQEEILHHMMAFMGGFMGLYAICAHGSYASAQTGNLMNIVIDLLGGEYADLAARAGAFAVFCGGVAAAWGMHEFCSLPMRELSVLTDALALTLTANLPSTIYALVRLYPIFFAASFQWGTFSAVGKYPSATLFLTGNLKNCVIRWLRWVCYRKAEDLTGARIYTLTILCYLLGGALGCAAVAQAGVQGAYCGFLPLAAVLAVTEAARVYERRQSAQGIGEQV